MFWRRAELERDEAMAQMTRILSLDFCDLQRSVSAQCLTECWKGAEVHETPTALVVCHHSLPDFAFHLQTDPEPDAIIKFLRVEGINGSLGLSVYAKHGELVAEWRPADPGHKPNRHTRKRLEALADKFGIPSLPFVEGFSKKTVGQVIAASVSASIIVAEADGEFSSDERERLVHLISCYKHNLMTPREILAFTEQHVKAMKDAGEEQWPGLMHSLTDGFSVSSKKTVLHAAGTMALADGEFSKSEQHKIANIASWMELRQEDLSAWIKEFEVTVKLAEITGVATVET